MNKNSYSKKDIIPITSNNTDDILCHEAKTYEMTDKMTEKMTDDNVQNFYDENLSAWECLFFISSFLACYEYVYLVVIAYLSE